MRAAIGLFLACIVFVAIAWWVSLIPGTVTAVIAGTTITASAPVALLLLAILFFLLYVLVRLLAWLFSLRRRVGGWQAGREDEAAALYEQLADRRDGRLLGLRGLIRLAVEKQEWERAATLAGQAEKAHPGAAWLRDERRWMAQQTGQWREALRLADPSTKASMAAAAAENEADPKAALALSKQAFDADPALPAAAIGYARRLRDAGRERQAQDVLKRAWSADPNPEIADAFVAPVEDKLARAREMAVLVRSNPDNVEAYVAIARAALDAGLAGEAKRQITAAQAAGLNERRLWSLLSEAEVMDGNADAAQEALRHMADADPDPAWRCTACGTTHERWHPICNACRASGTITWSKPGAQTGNRPLLAPKLNDLTV